MRHCAATTLLTSQTSSSPSNLLLKSLTWRRGAFFAKRDSVHGISEVRSAWLSSADHAAHHPRPVGQPSRYQHVRCFCARPALTSQGLARPAQAQAAGTAQLPAHVLIAPLLHIVRMSDTVHRKLHLELQSESALSSQRRQARRARQRLRRLGNISVERRRPERTSLAARILISFCRVVQKLVVSLNLVGAAAAAGGVVGGDAGLAAVPIDGVTADATEAMD